jgi:hypothetical protein
MKRFDTPEKQRALAGKLREIGREVRQVKRRVLADAYPHKDYMQMTIRELADVKRIAKEKGIAL